MRPPCYAENEVALDCLAGEAKSWACPHCGRGGTLNGHGFLRGLSAEGTSKTAVRGRRYFCSNRGQRPGCGRTVSVHLAQVWVGASVRTAAWWQVVAARLGGQSVLGAWEKARSGFSVEAAYRWARQWNESAVRTALWRGREPPLGVAAALEAAYGTVDPVAVFQARHQYRFPGFGS